MNRRDFLKMVGLGSLMALLPKPPEPEPEPEPEFYHPAMWAVNAHHGPTSCQVEYAALDPDWEWPS